MRIFIGSLVASLLLTFAGCSGHNNIIGKWRQYVLGGDGTPYKWGDTSFEVFKDHSCVIHVPHQQIDCHWSELTDQRVKLEGQMMGTSLLFIGTVKGDSADFRDPQDTEVHFVRLGSAEDATVQKSIEATKLTLAGARLMKNGHYHQAVQKLQEGMKLGNLHAMQFLGICYYYGKGVSRDPDKGRALWQKSGELGNTKGYVQLAESYVATHEVKRAISEYKKAVEKGDTEAENNLAWILATCKDATLRDGKRAVELASDAVKHDGSSFASWDTLAAAYARNGQFSKAESTERHAITLVMGRYTSDPNAFKDWTQMQHHLGSYQRKRPLVDACK